MGFNKVLKAVSAGFFLIGFNVSQVSVAQNQKTLFEACDSIVKLDKYQECLGIEGEFPTYDFNTKSKSIYELLDKANSGYERAMIYFYGGKTSSAIKEIDTFLEENPNSAKGYLLRGLINDWDLDSARKALADMDKAIELDKSYAEAYAYRGVATYEGLSDAYSANEDFEKAIELAPEDPLINYERAYFLTEQVYKLVDNPKTQIGEEDKIIGDMKFIELVNQTENNYRKAITNYGNMDLIGQRIYPFGYLYTVFADIGYLNRELAFFYKDRGQRKLFKSKLYKAINSFSRAIENSPSKTQTEQIYMDREFELLAIDELYLDRGNAYSWIDKEWRKACKDWKKAKSYGNKEAQTNYREWRC